jgi:hypothetical protein
MIEIASLANQMTISAPTINSQPTFPVLRILPIEKLVPHEYSDTERTQALQERLLADGILRNPPIVAPLQNADGEYLVLDGANRTNALKMMKVPHILVQIVSQGGSGFELSTWNQVVLGIRPEKLISILKDIKEVDLIKGLNPGFQKDGIDKTNLVQVHLPFGGTYFVHSNSPNLRIKVNLINLILSRIRQYARLDRTNLDVGDVLTDLHTDLAGLITFPCYKFEQVVQLAKHGQLIPSGITHFSISPRALRVNYMISDLRSDKSLTEKNELLMEWTKGLVSMNRLRLYSETTVMFDE